VVFLPRQAGDFERAREPVFAERRFTIALCGTAKRAQVIPLDQRPIVLGECVRHAEQDRFVGGGDDVRNAIRIPMNRRGKPPLSLLPVGD
jgi:hypothetical protein